MKLPYAILTSQSSFLYIEVDGVDFTQINSTGDTYLSVYRMFNGVPVYPPYGTPDNQLYKYSDTPPNDPDGAIHYTPLAYVAGNKFTFVMDNNIFIQAGGRFKCDLYYKGTYIISCLFVYNKLPVSVETNV